MKKSDAKSLAVELNQFYRNYNNTYEFTPDEWDEITIENYELLMSNKVAGIVADLEEIRDDEDENRESREWADNIVRMIKYFVRVAQEG